VGGHVRLPEPEPRRRHCDRRVPAGRQKLSGNLTLIGAGGQDYAVVGIVSGNEIKLSQPTFGTLNVNGNEMSGIMDGWDNAKITLRKQ
jgi:hypothetical protein